MVSPVELAVKDEAEILCLVFLLDGRVVQLNRGHLSFRSVNVVWMDFISLTLNFHLLSHFSISMRWSCKLVVAVVGLSWVAKIAVSSANVPMRNQNLIHGKLRGDQIWGIWG
jgi:hypothetical protein